MERFFEEDQCLSPELARELAEFYRHHLLEEVMPPWKERSLDRVHGGYETNFNQDWEIVADTKNEWAQTRNLIMFTLIYEHVEQDSKWLELIKSGRDFLTAHFYAGNGRWNYRVSNDGKTVLEGPISLLGDMFAIEALAQYILVTGDKQDMPLLLETYQSVQKLLADPDNKDIMPHVWEPGLERHSHYMLMVNVLPYLEKILGREAIHPYLMECIDKILYFFAGSTSDHYLLEYRALDGSMVDSAAGHMIDPGHIFESMWFCLRVCMADRDEKRIQRILEITNHTFDMAVDRQYGGLFHLLDCTGRTAFKKADPRNRQLAWNDKVDWVNCEALYLFALVATHTGDKRDFERFLLLHNYCQKYFYDAERGDWITTLSPDGKPIANNKGTKHRCAFHLPRSILDTYLAFDAYAKNR